MQRVIEGASQLESDVVVVYLPGTFGFVASEVLRSDVCPVGWAGLIVCDFD